MSLSIRYSLRIPVCLLGFLLLLPMVSDVLAATDQHGHPVRVAVVEHRTIVRTVSTYGVLAPKIEDLSFRIDGRIASFHVQEGQSVEKGFVLAELEKRDASDTVEKTRLDYDQAARQLERFRKLAGERLIQAAQLETAQDTFEASRIAYEQAQLNLARCDLRAPAAGVILKEYLNSRTTVTAGKPIYSFRDISESWITEVELTDRNAFVFGTGTKAKARFAPYPNTIFEGELTKQAGIADENDSLYTVEITIANNGRELRPGMVVEIDLSHETPDVYSVVPLDALVDLRRNRGAIYLLSEAGDSVTEIEVHIVSVTGSDVALMEDIPAGANVVIRGQQSLRDKSPVHVL